MPPRGKKISLGEFQNVFSTETTSSTYEDPRRITTEDVSEYSSRGGYSSYRGNDNYGEERIDRYGGDRGDRYGGERYGGDRYGDRGDRYGGDRYGGDRYGGDRYGGDRYGEREGRYGDRGGRYGDRGPREPQGPLPVPDEPPYRAFIRNIPKDFTEKDVAEVFQDHEIEDISVPTGFEGNKGFAFVTFKKREDLQYFAEELKEIEAGEGLYLKIDVSNPARRDDRRGGMRRDRFGDEEPRESLADNDMDWRNARAEPRGRGRGRGGRFGGDRGGRFGGDRFGGDRFGGERSGSRFGGERREGFGRFRESTEPTYQEQPDAIYLDSSNPFGDSAPVVPKEEQTSEEKTSE